MTDLIIRDDNGGELVNHERLAMSYDLTDSRRAVTDPSDIWLRDLESEVNQFDSSENITDALLRLKELVVPKKGTPETTDTEEVLDVDDITAKAEEYLKSPDLPQQNKAEINKLIKILRGRSKFAAGAIVASTALAAMIPSAASASVRKQPITHSHPAAAAPVGGIKKDILLLGLPKAGGSIFTYKLSENIKAPSSEPSSVPTPIAAPIVESAPIENIPETAIIPSESTASVASQPVSVESNVVAPATLKKVRLPRILPSRAAKNTVIAKAGDTESSIAEQAGESLSTLQADNPLPNPNLIYPGESFLIRSTAETNYIAKAGDTESSIAEQAGESLSTLQADNPLPNPNLIYPGEVFRLGGTAAGTVTHSESVGDNNPLPVITHQTKAVAPVIHKTVTTVEPVITHPASTVPVVPVVATEAPVVSPPVESTTPRTIIPEHRGHAVHRLRDKRTPNTEPVASAPVTNTDPTVVTPSGTGTATPTANAGTETVASTPTTESDPTVAATSAPVTNTDPTVVTPSGTGTATPTANAGTETVASTPTTESDPTVAATSAPVTNTDPTVVTPSGTGTATPTANAGTETVASTPTNNTNEVAPTSTTVVPASSDSSNKDRTIVSAVPITTPAVVDGAPITSVDSQVYDLLKSDGFTPVAAAGILGNTEAESGNQPERLENTTSGVQTPAESLSTDVLNSPNVGWGEFQATPAAKMVNPIEAANGDPDSVEAQVNWMANEVKGTPLFDELNNATTPEAAAELFELDFERPYYDNTETRQEFAEAFYDAFNVDQTTPATPSNNDNTPTTGNDGSSSPTAPVISVPSTVNAANGISNSGSGSSGSN